MGNATTKLVSGHLATGARLALVGILVNAILALVKIFAGWIGHSYVLIADGIESALDIVSSFVIWGGLKFAARPPDETHPYGHGKAEPIAAIIVSTTVIIAAFALAVQSVREILTPHHAPASFTLYVLLAVIVIKQILYRIVLRFAKKARSTAVETDALHHRTDAITSGAAFIGISVALMGGPGYESADDWAALVACALIGYNGVRLLKPAIYEVMDTAPPKDIEDFVRKVAASVTGVVEIEQCRVRKMGLEYYVDLHAGVDGGISVRDGHNIAHRVKDAVLASNPSIVDVLVHIEPVG